MCTNLFLQGFFTLWPVATMDLQVNYKRQYFLCATLILLTHINIQSISIYFLVIIRQILVKNESTSRAIFLSWFLVSFCSCFAPGRIGVSDKSVLSTHCYPYPSCICLLCLHPNCHACDCVCVNFKTLCEFFLNKANGKRIPLAEAAFWNKYSSPILFAFHAKLQQRRI